MDGVKTLGFELLGSSTDSFHGISFPSLEILEFRDMQGWEIWSTRGGDNDGTARSFPRLVYISIRDCPKLVEISTDLMPSLEVLQIEGCSHEVLKSMVGVSSSIKRLIMENIKGLAQLNGEVLKLLGTVEDLSISTCNNLRYLCESNSEVCKFLVSLRKLEIRSCRKLVSLGDQKAVNLGNIMEYVREVDISNCVSLKSYICPKNVERMRISYCCSLTSLTFSTTVHELPSSLNSLLVKCCDNIESISEKGFRNLPPPCLEYLEISNCKNLKLFPYEHLESLTSLEDMLIYNCPSMDYSFSCGLWPPNLRSLWVGCLNKPMSEWRLQNYPTSLVRLKLYGRNSGVVSFVANVKDVTSSSFLLPPSLTSLEIRDFMDVESVSEVLQHLTCLEELVILSSPKLKYLPETNTNRPLSLNVTVY